MRLQLSCTFTKCCCVGWEREQKVGVCSEKQFGGKESFGFGGLVFQWWVERGDGSCRFPCSACRVGAEFIPVITVVANEVGDFEEGLVRYDVLERHGSGMGGRFR